MIRQFLANLRRHRDEWRGQLPERHLDQPGIRPDQIATGSITPDKLAAWEPPISLPKDVAFPPIQTDKLIPRSPNSTDS